MAHHDYLLTNTVWQVRRFSSNLMRSISASSLKRSASGSSLKRSFSSGNESNERIAWGEGKGKSPDSFVIESLNYQEALSPRTSEISDYDEENKGKSSEESPFVVMGPRETSSPDPSESEGKNSFHIEAVHCQAVSPRTSDTSEHGVTKGKSPDSFVIDGLSLNCQAVSPRTSDTSEHGVTKGKSPDSFVISGSPTYLETASSQSTRAKAFQDSLASINCQLDCNPKEDSLSSCVSASVSVSSINSQTVDGGSAGDRDMLNVIFGLTADAKKREDQDLWCKCL